MSLNWVDNFIRLYQGVVVSSDDKLVIRGVTKEGKTLRPGDWIERISSTLASFGQDQRLQYSKRLPPM